MRSRAFREFFSRLESQLVIKPVAFSSHLRPRKTLLASQVGQPVGKAVAWTEVWATHQMLQHVAYRNWHCDRGKSCAGAPTHWSALLVSSSISLMDAMVGVRSQDAISWTPLKFCSLQP